MNVKRALKREWADLSFSSKHSVSSRSNGGMQGLWKKRVNSAAKWAEEGVWRTVIN